jgi:riboflavin kinase/FMN adenylyltransferase
LKTVTTRARDHDGTAVVYTFDPHPRKVIHGSDTPGLLVTLDQKIELIEASGIDLMVVQEFSLDFAKTTPEAFIRHHIHECLAPREVYVGYDFHYGRDREGSMRLLTQLGPDLGFSVTVIPEVRVDGQDVSSTRIRERLAIGDVAGAARMLGRPYAMRGRVVQGDQRGRRLNFPTLNLDPENELLPAHGVYATWVQLLDGEDGRVLPKGNGEIFAAVTNVGRRPTFKDSDPPLAESHLLDFSGDLYGRRYELRFEARLRGERRFPGPEALRDQIARDADETRRVLGVPPASERSRP